ncbi:hypothetical protein [Caldibacillus debilis]|jgi:hypothetical protein|uniref:Uncharacterized protein n=1 Tax=Caldibacillus debilis GB1 TaxID=1339248 RepID=A0A420VH57_9BACI|nr:hypothetical protein [Caldibacillus debilis]RKO62917.1 hypothetical protein Cdeb_00003 [Caldibacillus debilis GB1]
MVNPVTYSIPMRNHWWFDTGIIGLYLVGKDMEEKYQNISLSFSDECQALNITYCTVDELKKFLTDCYEELARRHWNVSTKKQKEARELVIYDKEKDEFFLYPKRQPTPIPALFVKGRSWRADSIELKKLCRKNPQLAKRAKEFAERHKRKFYGKEEKLLFEPPVCHTKLEIMPVERGKKQICSVCGRNLKCVTVSQPAYLLFASENATVTFNSEVKQSNLICWECNLLGRFAVETALYKKNNNNKVYILQIYTPHLKKLNDLQGKMGVRSHVRELDEDYFFTNMIQKKDEPIAFINKPYEFLWAYYYKIFSWYLDYGQANQFDPFAEMLGMVLENAPVQLYLFEITDRGGNAGFSIDNFIVYDDSAYMFRLLHAMREQEINLKSFFFDLADRTTDKRENQTLYRERILRRILEKRSIILQVEQFAFHISRSGDTPNLKHILDFTVNYESLMSQTESERMGKMNAEQIKTAVNLGTQIVMNARDNMLSEKGGDLKKIKGDLYALRKTRTPTDFLNQLNTFQMRYGIIVSKELLEGMIEQVEFEHFKAYVVTSALNTFNRLMNNKNSQKGEMTDGEQTA